ncbi:hypothetical protein H4219_003428 [Mycoemilia scoparia]|uniref:Small ribosomal subunit protein mS38 n=1 Tax=Mycoemilia scoparia TaxID=417184 RepID=A0A9W8DSY2_9FUNG|nr:hypothetical protein H4219_003428 [Mycoemilia scoparia]
MATMLLRQTSKSLPTKTFSLLSLRRFYSESSSTKGRQSLGIAPKASSTSSSSSSGAARKYSGVTNSLPFSLDLQQSQLTNTQFYAQYRPLLGIEDVSNQNKSMRGVGSSSTVTPFNNKSNITRNENAQEIIPTYTAKSSFFMSIPDEAEIPEFIHRGVMAEVLFDHENGSTYSFVGKLKLCAEDKLELVQDYLENIQMNIENGDNTVGGGAGWSKRKENSIKRTLQTQTRIEKYFMDRQIDEWRKIDPNFVPAEHRHKVDVDGVSNGASSGVVEYRLTSILRKRKKKMNKHKQRKLRKRTRALRKKLGK